MLASPPAAPTPAPLPADVPAADEACKALRDVYDAIGAKDKSPSFTDTSSTCCAFLDVRCTQPDGSPSPPLGQKEGWKAGATLTKIKFRSGTELGGSGTLPGALLLPLAGTLEYLDLGKKGDRSFSGTLPAELTQLTALQKLSLTTDKVSGTIPHQLGRLPALEKVTLLSKHLSGTVPGELCHRSDGSLRKLYLDDNVKLSGTLPPECFLLPTLEAAAPHRRPRLRRPRPIPRSDLRRRSSLLDMLSTTPRRSPDARPAPLPLGLPRRSSPPRRRASRARCRARSPRRSSCSSSRRSTSRAACRRSCARARSSRSWSSAVPTMSPARCPQSASRTTASQRSTSRGPRSAAPSRASTRRCPSSRRSTCPTRTSRAPSPTRSACSAASSTWPWTAQNSTGSCPSRLATSEGSRRARARSKTAIAAIPTSGAPSRATRRTARRPRVGRR
mmetsp:Transcript_19867/g.63341  ORF Transcript_19867/g.63341 Transcript_19867/m.63341 type:complete len:446 (+) Transcript_19867:61-1398(+)